MHGGRRRWLCPAEVAAVAGTGIILIVTIVIVGLIGRPDISARSSGPGPERSAPSVELAENRRSLPRQQPLLIAHRGASGNRAENTIAAFRLAIAMGTDYIEGDLVVSGDGVLVARHERALSSTTDIAGHPEFADRRTTKIVSGTPVTDWFTEDFALAELKTLRATKRHHTDAAVVVGPAAGPPPAEQTIPTIDEMIALARRQRSAAHRDIGLYFELKDPAYYASIGLAPEPLLVNALRAANLAHADAPVFVESFDPQSLRTVHALTDVPLIQLIGGVGGVDDPATSADTLRNIAGYAAGIGVERARLRASSIAEISVNPDLVPPGKRAGPATPRLDTTLVEAVHREHLELHVYTFSASTANTDVLAKYRAYYAAGVDGVFTDNPDFARAALP
ncbi:MAG: glycerophosphodiester phosphodiesterase [Dactylosporangium sp.]|nr:glycerophosphodiester phosphodiesterase [Dactylosporangium sp.]NNJ60863.1 glycerophosphodiester phosphodiesterase [Dactylosporangium sp.]